MIHAATNTMNISKPALANSHSLKRTLTDLCLPKIKISARHREFIRRFNLKYIYE